MISNKSLGDTLLHMSYSTKYKKNNHQAVIIHDCILINYIPIFVKNQYYLCCIDDDYITKNSIYKYIGETLTEYTDQIPYNSLTFFQPKNNMLAYLFRHDDKYEHKILDKNVIQMFLSNWLYFYDENKSKWLPFCYKDD